MPATSHTACPPALHRFARKVLHRHAKQRKREYRLAAHGVDIGYCIGRGDAAKIVRIVHDRQEKIGGGDDRLLVVQAVNGCIVARFRPDQQVGKGGHERRLPENFPQHRWR
jgi:hypothetical protein